MPELDFSAIVPSKASSALVMMHGFGSNKEDMFDMVHRLRKSFPYTAFYCPNAPEPVEGMSVGLQWFPLTKELMRMQRATLQDFDDICLSMMKKAAKVVPTINHFIKMITRKHKIKNDHIVLAGFSQGAQMALQSGLTIAPSVAGIIAFSGIIGQLPSDKIQSVPPILITHGTEDSVIPFDAHQAAVSQLREIRAKVTNLVLEGEGHAISEKAITAAINFLKKVLKY